MAASPLSHIPRAWLLLAAIGTTPLWTSFSRPGMAAVDQRIDFDIPAQPLATALTQYFRASGVQLLYDSSLADGRRSSAVKGRFTPREALRLLLRGTGLMARYSRGNAAILTVMGEDSKAEPLVPLGRVVVRERIVPSLPTRIQQMQFYDQIESELRAYLQADRRTNRLSFGLRATIRIAPEGRIERIEIARAQDPSVEHLVLEVLAGKSVSPPPQGLAQPLILMLRGRPGHQD